MLRPWNPFSITHGGQPIGGKVAVRMVVHGPMTPEQGVMAQQTYYEFKATHRVSIVGNTFKNGVLADGSPYRISSIEGVDIMWVQPKVVGGYAVKAFGGVVRGGNALFAGFTINGDDKIVTLYFRGGVQGGGAPGGPYRETLQLGQIGTQWPISAVPTGGVTGPARIANQFAAGAVDAYKAYYEATGTDFDVNSMSAVVVLQHSSGPLSFAIALSPVDGLVSAPITVEPRTEFPGLRPPKLLMDTFGGIPIPRVAVFGPGIVTDVITAPTMKGFFPPTATTTVFDIDTWVMNPAGTEMHAIVAHFDGTWKAPHTSHVKIVFHLEGVELRATMSLVEKAEVCVAGAGITTKENRRISNGPTPTNPGAAGWWAQGTIYEDNLVGLPSLPPARTTDAPYAVLYLGNTQAVVRVRGEYVHGVTVDDVEYVTQRSNGPNTGFNLLGAAYTNDFSGGVQWTITMVLVQTQVALGVIKLASSKSIVETAAGPRHHITLPNGAAESALVTSIVGTAGTFNKQVVQFTGGTIGEIGESITTTEVVTNTDPDAFIHLEWAPPGTDSFVITDTGPYGNSSIAIQAEGRIDVLTSMQLFADSTSPTAMTPAPGIVAMGGVPQGTIPEPSPSAVFGHQSDSTEFVSSVMGRAHNWFSLSDYQSGLAWFAPPNFFHQTGPLLAGDTFPAGTRTTFVGET